MSDHTYVRGWVATNASFSEEKLDEISRKIDRICLTVDKLSPLPPNAGARLVCSPTVGESVSTEATSRSYTAPCINETHESDGGSSSDLGEDVALAVQADFATELAERLVDNAHPLDDLPEVKSSLSALKNSISATKDRHKRWLAAGAGPASPTPYVEGTQLPPMQASMTALQRLRGKTHPNRPTYQTCFPNLIKRIRAP